MQYADRNALYQLSKLQRITREEFIKTAAEYSITVPMFSVLYEINFGPRDITSSELARRSYVSPQSVNLVVQRLADRGLVHREPLGHGRRLALTLTDTGRELLEKLQNAQGEVIDSMLRHANINEPDLKATLVSLIESFERSTEQS